MEEMTSQLQGLFQSIGSEKKRTRKLRIREALKILAEEEAAKMVNEDEIKVRALENVEQNGLVFLDEIDKGDAPRRGKRRGCIQGRRAARPAAAGGRLHGDDPLRHGENGPHPVHRLRRVSFFQTIRPDPRTAGQVADSGGTRCPGRGRVQPYPGRTRRFTDTAVLGAHEDRTG